MGGDQRGVSRKIRPIYNGVDTAHFPVTYDEPTVPTITWVGRIDPLKDIETLLRAFAKVRTSLPEARLRIFGATPEGNEPYHARCLRLADELDLGESATFEVVWPPSSTPITPATSSP